MEIINSKTFRYLGNVKLSNADKGNNVLEIVDTNDFYPFGMNFLNGNSSFGIGFYTAYKLGNHELQEFSAYDFGRWTSIDRKSELLESASSYVYALNSPILYIDKDGELPILINGRVESDSERGNASYWTQSIINTIKGSGIPNPGGEFHFVDGDRYLSQDFSGNWHMKNGSNLWGNSPGWRYEAGRSAMTDTEFKTILSKLARDPESGKITEKIQIYTHSRGAAFGTGYTERLLELIKEHSSEFSDPNNVVDFVLNMAPHQSNFLDAPSGADNYSIDHSRDKLSGNDMKGLKGAFTSNEKSNSFFGAHSITSFQKDIKAFTSAFLKGGASQAVINNFIDEMKKKYDIKVTVSE
jgi:hypothetical protein